MDLSRHNYAFEPCVAISVFVFPTYQVHFGCSIVLL